MSPSQHTAWVGLGSNLDDPQQQVRSGVRALSELPSCTLTRVSGLYRSPPWGMADQPDFVNAVACLATRLDPHELLGLLKEIELSRGRRRDGPRWGPRTLDLDLLLYDQRAIDTPELVLPHPRMTERAFVLAPLAELDPELQVPGKGHAGELLQQLGMGDCRLVE
ncbi:MAG: 2-amino-4-hydroxy-6-hydroxymethyldihydropteridine diphosphokinase [Rhodanobacteraceae bacterium]